MDITTAIQKAGSINALALVLGVSRQVIQSYKKHGLPSHRVDQLRSSRPEWFLKEQK